MKSLKRTLCLVLALVMVLGLFGIASATSFTDDNSIQYKEAVDVMTGIGAINGMGDGSFNPKGTITRAQAAKLVTYTMLGATAAEKLAAGTTSSFTDVTAPAYSWAIPSIEFLVKAGVINGRGDGTFDPNGNITSYELGKMLLCAIGYGVKNEYTGAGWDLQVAIDGNKVGETSYGRFSRLAIFSNRAANSGTLGSHATREEAALYCFNAIQKLKVEYVASLDVYADGTNQLGVAKGSIGTDIYPGLKYVGDADAFGNPLGLWKLGANTLYTIEETPIVTFTSEKTVDDLRKAVVSAGYNWVTNQSDATKYPYVNVYVNGVGNGTNEVSLSTLSANIVGDGMTLKAYADVNNNLKCVTVVNTFVGQVTGITTDDITTSDIDERALEVTLLNGTKVTASVIDKTAGFDAAYTASKTMMDAGSKMFLIVADNSHTGTGTTALSVAIPTVSELRVSSVTAEGGVNKSFTADGKSYSFAAYTPSVVKNSVNANSTYTVLTNQYGYVVLVDLVNANKNIGVVVKAGMTPSAFGDIPSLKVVTPTGEEVVLLMSSWNGTATPAATDITAADYENRIVEYTPDTGANAGKYRVTNISATGNKAAKPLTYNADPDDNQVLEIKTGATNIGGLGIYANSQTVFVIGTSENGKPVYTVYTGVDNVPNIKATATNDSDNPKYNYSMNATGTYASVFYVDKSAVQADSSKISFVAIGKDRITLSDQRSGYDCAIISCTAKAITDIKSVFIPETLIASSNLIADTHGNPAAPFIVEYKLEENPVDGKNVVASLTRLPADDPETEAKPGVGADAPSNSIVGLGTVVPGTAIQHTYTNDVNVWVIDPSMSSPVQKFQNGGINSIMTSENNQVFWLQSKKVDDQVSAVFVVKSDKEMTVTNTTTTGAAVITIPTTGTNDATWTNGPVLKAALPSGVTATTYKWEYFNGSGWTQITGATDTLTVPATTFSAPGAYTIRCTATVNGEAVYGTMTLPVGVKVAYAAVVDGTKFTIDPAVATGDVAYGGTLTVTVKIADDATQTKIKATWAGGGSGVAVTYKIGDGTGTNGTGTATSGTDIAGAVAADDTVEFTVSNITEPITSLVFALS